MHNTLPLSIPEIRPAGFFPKGLSDSRHFIADDLDDLYAARLNRTRWEGLLSLTAVAGDLMMVLLGFVLAFWLRQQSSLIFQQNAGSHVPQILDYGRLILLGSGIVFVGLLSKNFYGYKDLIQPANIVCRFVYVLSICLFAFIGITLAVRTVPPISRGFVIFAWGFIFVAVYGWRLILSRVLRHPALVLRLRKRLVVVGAGEETVRIKAGLDANPDMEFVGWIQGNKSNRDESLNRYKLGSLHDLGDILKKHAVDVAVLTESESLQREAVSHVARVCEREHVQFKMVPHFFEIMISGLRPSVVGGVSVLGVDSLPVNTYENRIVKRMVDIVGATVGLVLSCPLILIFGALVYWESPGPIFYRQVRTGRRGQLFQMIKIRSMKMDAEGSGKARWAKENDPRRLRVGAFMRKWNIDEVPQFWNVLKGEMSLVGPRPERPELIEHFKFTVPHYQTRHNCRPGMTGWAQVNGWRGNTSLEERIRSDIWYLESWNIFLDFRIMVMTFFRRQNAY
jgi:exopolysaccharide biosynthesis polyprenyl glycosylphosphotransferase